jgi:hypothetical protein
MRPNQMPRPETEPQQHPDIEGRLDVENGALAAFPINPEEGSEIKVQLGRVYNKAGQQIDFEDNTWSRLNEPDREHERMVILLTETGRQLFFRGTEAIDVVEGAHGEELVRRPIPGPTKKLPPVTIGKKYIFSDGEPVLQVCVAEDVLDLDKNPGALRELMDRQGVKGFRNNPFEELDKHARLAEEAEQTKRTKLHTPRRRVKEIAPIDPGTSIEGKDWKYSVEEVLLTEAHSDVNPGRFLRVRGMSPDKRKAAGMIDTSHFASAMESVARKDWGEVMPKVARHEKKSRLARLAIIHQAVKDEVLYGGEGVSNEELKKRKKAAQEARQRHYRNLGSLATRGWEKTRGAARSGARATAKGARIAGQKTKKAVFPEHANPDAFLWGWRRDHMLAHHQKKLRDDLEAAEMEAFRHGELIQYPKDKGGRIPLAESYSKTGDQIVWEAHPFTRTDETVRGSERKVILIAENNNFYYLRGDKLYDMSRTIKEGALMSRSLKRPLPNVVIGAPAPLFGDKKIREVVVHVRPVEDKADARDILVGASERKTNPFEAFDKAIEILS